MTWRTLCLFVIAITALVTLPAAVEAKKPKLKPPKAFSYSQNIETQKLEVSFTKARGAKKTVIKLRKGTTTLATKRTKTKRAKFPDSLITHGETYNFRYRHLKTSTKRASNWRKLVFTFDDADYDDDGIENDADTDDDNDGIPDDEDEFPNDHDNDGTPDYEDADDDDDLYEDTDDEFPNDHDNDGIDDINDDDDDGDGIPDSEDAFPYDKDNDGIPDNEDPDYIDEITPDPITYTVNINSTGVDDNTITIQVNDYVKWVNKHSGIGHSIEVSDGWSSGPLDFGASATHQFTSAGTFTYDDPTFESTSFSGTIIVEE